MLGSLIILGMVILCISIGQPWIGLAIFAVYRALDHWQDKGR